MYYLTKAWKSSGLENGVSSCFICDICCWWFIWWRKYVSGEPSISVSENITGGESSFFIKKGWLFGIVMALVGVVIIGGI